MGKIGEFINYLQLILNFYAEDSDPDVAGLLAQLSQRLEEIKSCV